MAKTDNVTLADLHAANILRQAEWCPDQVPDLSFRGNELGGECGEAQNVIKKLERERLGWRGSRASLDELAQELADVVICADLCAVTAGIDLGAAVVAKFNATSEKVGLTTKLSRGLDHEADHAELRAVMLRLSRAKSAGGIEDPKSQARVLGDAVDTCIGWIREYLAEAPRLASPPITQKD